MKMKNKKGLKWGILGAVVFLLAAAAGAYWFFGGGVEVSAETVFAAPFQDSYTVEGRIFFGNHYVITSGVSGKIKEVCVRENTPVEEDTVIVRLEDDSIVKQLEQAEKELASARKAFENIEKMYGARKALYESGAVSKEEFDLSETEYYAAKSAVDETAVAELKKQLENCTIKAGRKGVVADLPVKNAGMLSEGSEVATIYCRDTPKAEADVLTSAVTNIREGSPVTVKLNFQGKTEKYAGTVEEIYDYAETFTSVLGLNEYKVHVIVSLDPDSSLEKRDGYGADISFHTFESDSCIRVPAAAVFSEGETSFVYRITDGKAVKTPVVPEYASSAGTVISSGLSDGDVIITYANVDGLSDGVKVEFEAER